VKGTILFGHGARNPEYVQPFHRIREAVLAKAPGTQVEIGFLELTQPPLEAAIESLVARGVTRIEVVPIFFAPGRHVLKDLPELVGHVLDRYPQLDINIARCVGEIPSVIDAMAEFALAPVFPDHA
jgi:sirohydrochlorin cobaltochelatase